MVSGRVRLVLKERDPGNAFGRLAYRQRWHLERNIIGDEHTAHEEVYEVANSDTRIHYTEDPILRLAYVTAVGSRAEEIADLVRQKLKIFTFTELLDDFTRAKTRDDLIVAVYQLAAASRGQRDEQIVQALGRALQDADPEVRRAAIVAMGYAEFEELSPLLELLAEKDPDEAVRGDARYMLDGLKRIWKERPDA